MRLEYLFNVAIQSGSAASYGQLAADWAGRCGGLKGAASGS
jgi:hypothetical protein